MKPDTPADTPPDHATQRAALHARLAAAELSPWRDAIDALCKPAIGLRTRPGKGHVVRATRVGGEPDLPIDVDWPEGADGPLLFVMQVRLAEIARFDLEQLLPSDGHLALFTDRTCDDVAVLHFPAGAELVRHAWVPLDDEPFDGCDVDVLPELHLPTQAALAVLPRDAFERYWEQVWLPWRASIRPGRAGEPGIHQLLGYAAADDLGEQGADDEVLIGFDSDDRAKMEWGDAQCVWTILPRAALVARAWDQLRAVT